jgi:hypothetical protein
MAFYPHLPAIRHSGFCGGWRVWAVSERLFTYYGATGEQMVKLADYNVLVEKLATVMSTDSLALLESYEQEIKELNEKFNQLWTASLAWYENTQPPQTLDLRECIEDLKTEDAECPYCGGRADQAVRKFKRKAK